MARSPAGSTVMSAQERPQLGELLALDFQELAKEIVDIGGRGRFQGGIPGGGHIELKVHGSLISAWASIMPRAIVNHICFIPRSARGR